MMPSAPEAMQQDAYIVETPENIELAYDIAGIGSRFLAAIVDTLLIGIAQVVVIFGLGVISDAFAFAESVLIAIGAFVGFAILWGYYIAFELAWNGQSPGKRLFGLRVVAEGGRPITTLGSVIRNIIRIIDFLPALYGIGVIAMFVDRRARRLGDLASGTLVVRERADVTLESLVSAAKQAEQPLVKDEQQELPDISMLTDSDFAVLRAYIEQRRNLAPAVRRRMAARLGNGLAARMDGVVDYDAEQLVERTIIAYQRRRAQERAVQQAERVEGPEPHEEAPS